MKGQRLEHMTDQEIWRNLKDLKRQAAYAWHYDAEEYNKLKEMISEVEAEITRRDV